MRFVPKTTDFVRVLLSYSVALHAVLQSQLYCITVHLQIWWIQPAMTSCSAFCFHRPCKDWFYFSTYRIEVQSLNYCSKPAQYCGSHVDLQGNGIEKVVGNRSGVSWWMKLPFVRGIVRHAILHYYLLPATLLYRA